MTRPDAIPVRPVGTRAVLPPAAQAALFGAGATLRPSAVVEVVQTGAVVVRAPVEPGPTLSLWLDASTEVEGAISLRGPVGAVSVEARRVRSRLVVPARQRRAWGMAETAVVGLGGLAVALGLTDGPDVAAEIEKTLWLAAGRPDTARWLPSTDLSPAPDPTDDPAGALEIERRVITETDVRQARLHRRRLRVRPGQIVTPSARSLAREWHVFEE